MNRIEISLKSGESINLIDDEDISKAEMLQKLSSLYSVNNIAIIHTNTTSVIIRPSNIDSILVDEIPVKEIGKQEQQKEEIGPPPKLESKEHIDIITDVD